MNNEPDKPVEISFPNDYNDSKEEEKKESETESKAMDEFITAKSESVADSCDELSFRHGNAIISSQSANEYDEVFTGEKGGAKEFEDLFAEEPCQFKAIIANQRNAPTTISCNQFEQFYNAYEKPYIPNPFIQQKATQVKAKGKMKNPFEKKSVELTEK